MRIVNFILPCLVLYSFSAPAVETIGIYTKKNMPKWQSEMKERAKELEQLQQQNGAGKEHLTKTDFPTTIDDLSFSARQQLEREGLEPFKDNVAYHGLNIKRADEWCPDHLNDPGCEKYKAAAEQQNANNANNTNNQNNNSNNLNAEDKEIVQAIVDFLNPRNQAERDFFTALATDYVAKEDKDNSLMLDDSFVYNFLSENNNLEKYKPGLINLSGVAENDDLKIYLDWDEILIQISTVLDATLRKHGALVCENNRSYQTGIDTALWVATAAAAIASFGTGGVAVAGGRAAVGAGLKALAKGASKVGLKSAGKTMSKAGSKQLSKAALKTSFRTNLRGAAASSFGTFGKNGTIRQTFKHIRKKAGQNLATKKSKLLLTGAITGTIYETAGKPLIANGIKKKNGTTGKLYSLVASDISTEIINCQDLDYGEGCYAVCGYGATNDDLNEKVFKPILGQTYCVNESDFTLYNTQTKKPLMLNEEQYAKVINVLKTQVVDQGKNKNIWKTLTNQRDNHHGCDWNEDDIDMYFGTYIYDPDTLEPSTNLIMEEVIRLDD